MKNIIEVKNITKKYSETAGNFDINLKIEDGKCFGILGPNGAGKTTLIRQIMGFIKQDSGEILMNNITPWNNQKILMEHVGYVAGEIKLFDSLTGKQYLELIFKFRDNIDKEFYNNLIKHFDIDINVKIKKMSKGMKQKIAIIGACMHKPKILIFDEPTSGLDPVMKMQFNQMVLKLKKEGTTIIICSHIFEEINELCDVAAFLKSGKLIQEIEIKDKNSKEAEKVFKEIYAQKNNL